MTEKILSVRLTTVEQERLLRYRIAHGLNTDSDAIRYGLSSGFTLGTSAEWALVQAVQRIADALERQAKPYDRPQVDKWETPGTAVAADATDAADADDREGHSVVGTGALPTGQEPG